MNELVPRRAGKTTIQTTIAPLPSGMDWDPMATADELIEDAADGAFLARMNAKVNDTNKPLFTLAEVTRCYTLVVGRPAEGNEVFIRDYCLPHMNQARNDLCFYK